jgi:hypothetical protein
MWKVQHVEEGKQLGRRMGLTGQCSFSGRISASMDEDLGRVASSSRSQSLSHRRVVARRACKQRTTTWSLVHRINRCQELKTNSNIAHDRSSVLSQILQRRRKMVSVRNVVPTLTSDKRQGLSLNGRCQAIGDRVLSWFRPRGCTSSSSVLGALYCSAPGCL